MREGLIFELARICVSVACHASQVQLIQIDIEEPSLRLYTLAIKYFYYNIQLL